MIRRKAAYLITGNSCLVLICMLASSLLCIKMSKYFWADKLDKNSISIDNIMKKEDLVNELSYNEQDFGSWLFKVKMPDDFQNIILTSRKKLKFLPIKKITFFNDYSNYIAYSYE